MGLFSVLYSQYKLLKDQLNDKSGEFTTDLLKYGVTEDYFNKVNLATEVLYKFYAVKLENTVIRSSLAYILNDNHSENVKICLIIDVLRSYEGLNHPTTFTTPEGVALLMLLDKLLGLREITAYKDLEDVSTATLSLIDIIPYISECSDSLGSKYSLYLAPVIGKKAPEMEKLYRKLIYNLCKTIAEVDGQISIAEEEWLREIALLNDEDPNNDLDICNL